MSKKKFLIIGSNSFSGSHFVNYLLNKKYIVFGISRSKELNDVFLPYKKNKYFKNFKFKKLDINNNLDLILKLVQREKFSYIVNFASQSMVAQSWEKPIDWYNTNVLGTINFLEKIKKFGFIKKYVHVSTPEVYGSTTRNLKESRKYFPSTPYAISRAACDMHLHSLYKNYNFPVIFTRAANVYGPGQQLYRIIPKTILTLKTKKKLILDGGGKSKRSFVYISDVVKATYDLCMRSKKGEIYHISTPELISIKNLVEKIFKLFDLSSKNYLIISDERKGKDKIYSLSSKKIKESIGWYPRVGLEKGLLKTIEWFEKNLIILKKQKNAYIHKK